MLENELRSLLLMLGLNETIDQFTMANSLFV